MLSALAVAVAGWLWGHRVTDASRVARGIEIEQGLRRGSVRGLLEISGQGNVAKHAGERLAARLSGGALAPGRVRRYRLALAAGAGLLVAASAGFALSAASHSDAVEVLTNPMRAARGDLLAPLAVVGLAPEVSRGARPVIRVTAPQRKAVVVHTRTAGAAWRRVRVPVADGEARLGIGPIEAATSVFASDARGTSDTLMTRPAVGAFVSELLLVAAYPAYLERPNEPLSASGTLSLPAGTQLRIRGRATVPLTVVELRETGAENGVPLPPEGTGFSGTLLVRASTVYHWNLASADGEPVHPPEPLRIEVAADGLPEVAIVTPTVDTSVTGETPLAVTVRAADDHGLAAITLRLRSGDTERSIPLEIPRPGGSATVTVDLRAVPPGGHVVLSAIAEEESAARRRVVSAARTVSVLGGRDQREAARAAALDASQLAAGVLETQRSVERRTAEIARSRGDRRPAGEREGSPSPAGNALASRARSVLDEQRTLGARADSLAALTRALESRLARAGALDDGLAARLAEVRALLERALTPELAARLADAEQAVRDNAEDQLRRSLSDVAREQRRAREQLERIVQMLRRAAIEGSLETLRAEAAELVSSAERGGGSDAAARAEQLQRDVGRVVEQLRAEGATAGIPPAQRAGARAGSAAAGLSSSAARAAAAGELRDAESALGEARAAQIAEWKSELAADLDASVLELLNLASAEEALARGMTSGRSEWRGEQGALEEAAVAVADRVSRAAKTSSLVSSRSDGLVRAARDRVARVSERSVPPRDLTQTGAVMRDAAGALSRAAASLVRDRERTNSARSASGFTELLEELQRLAAEQRGVNANAEGLLLLPGGTGGAEGRERARVLAQQQRGIARSLDELGDADDGGRAGPLAAEAHRLADALERAAVDASVLVRQERLYHRLLEGGRMLAGDSGEDENRREAIAARGDDFPVVRSAGVVPSGGLLHRLPPWSDLRGLTAEERQMVLDYFERLNATR